MATIPAQGSLQNASNLEFRCNHATQLESTYKSPDCLIYFQPQDNGSYAIKNAKNNQYYQGNITTMVDSVTGPNQQWYLLFINASSFYVQNLDNNQFMTSSASQLSSSAGSKEIWYIQAR